MKDYDIKNYDMKNYDMQKHRTKEYLALCDMDGTLFDTKEVNFCSYRDALLKHGIKLDRDFFLEQCFGKYYSVFVRLIFEREGKTITQPVVDAIHQEKKEIYASYLHMAKENTHLFEMLQSMKDKYYIAIVSVAMKKNVYSILEHFGRKELFDFIMTQEDMDKVKPEPDCFLETMDRFGIDAAHTVVFEDSQVGIEAARRSGASVFVVDKF